MVTGELVPFSPIGNLMHTVGEDDVPDWRPNDPFIAEMVIDWMEPGASIKRVLLLRETGGDQRCFPMFVDDLLDLLRMSTVRNGVVTGKWRVKKTGRKTVLYTIVKVI